MKLWESLLDILFPPRCGVCKKYTKGNVGLCRQCTAVIPQHTTLFCGECHARLPKLKKICHHHTPYILGAASSYDDEVVKGAIAALKFEHIHAIAKPLGNILASYWQHIPAKPERPLVVPMPLSRRRRRERGFNQSELIAKHFCRRTSLPMASNLLKRVRHRKPQMQLPREKRAENVAGCFAISPKTQMPKHILLIDDVSTSGATFAEAAHTLKNAGARNVIGLAVARA